MKVHLVPSELDRLAVCPKFQLNERVQAKIREQGSSLHAKLAQELPAEEIDDDSLRFAYEEAQAATKLLAPPDATVLTEAEIELPEFRMRGRIDFLAIFSGGSMANLVEFKFGRSEVPVGEENYQLCTCAIGAFNTYPELQQINAFLIQPLAPNWNLERLTPVTWTREDLPRLRDRVQALIDRVADPFSEPVPNDWCSRCRWFSSCPVTKAAVTALAPTAAEPSLPELASKSFAALTPADRGRLLGGLYRLSKLYEQLREQAIENNLDVEGFVWAVRTNPPTIRDSQGLLEHLAPELLKSDLAPALRLHWGSLIEALAKRWNMATDVVASELPLMYPTFITPVSESRFLRFTGARKQRRPKEIQDANS